MSTTSRGELNLWQFAIDVGGTFTDCWATSPTGQQHRLKLLSSSEVIRKIDAAAITGGSVKSLRLANGDLEPDGFWNGYTLQLRNENSTVHSSVTVADQVQDELTFVAPLWQVPTSTQSVTLCSPEEAPSFAIRYCLQLPLAAPLPPVQLRLGTTLATNALLTRSGATTALITSQGFGDLLEIGYQDRPQLFELTIHKHEPIITTSLEIDERLDAEGSVRRAPDVTEVKRQLIELKHQGIQSLAVCLLHAYKNPAHEVLIGEVAREVGFESVQLSHRVSPTLGMIERAETTVADAYLNPVLASYLQRLQTALHPDSRVRLMNSAGGMVLPQNFTGKDSLLSGPAGGVVGYAAAAASAGYEQAIGFDMGGTSTDVSRYTGKFDTVFRTEKNGVRINAPALAIETVAAGGGSICQFDGVKLTVGPQSASAEPGPACYGRDGPLTVTDMNYYLGRLPETHFPFPLHPEPVVRQLQAMASTMQNQTRQRLTLEQLAAGFLRVANVQMAEAMRSISVEQGSDPRNYVLAAFGGAAPQHACELARHLQISQVLVHPDGGILSAIGIAAANPARDAVQAIYQALSSELLAEVQTIAQRMKLHLMAAITAEEGLAPERVTTTSHVELRYVGQAATQLVSLHELPLEDAFHAAHRQMFGYADEDRQIEVVTIRARAIGTSNQTKTTPTIPFEQPTQRRETARTFLRGAWHDVPVYDRTQMVTGKRWDGPCLIVQSTSTIVVDSGWQAEMLRDGQVLLRDLQPKPAVETTTEVDPISLEVFNCRFQSIATQMGVTLQKTASSVNVKERLDYSCAVFTSTGDLVANAPHVPVHLGAMSETVRHVMADHTDLGPGDVVVTNHPFRGGSHLPDVTVVTPVFDNGELAFFAASRAHHAEIGGVAPGSMWPHSTRLSEEGVLIPSLKLVAGGESRLENLAELLRSGPYPSRSVATNLADVQAQIASNQQGLNDLLALSQQSGSSVVQAYMRHIQAAAEQKMRQALTRVEDGEYCCSDQLDDGSAIRVAITVNQDSATVDFAGSADVHPGNLNANLAIVRAAVTYCFRCLIAEDIPLNEGVLAPITLRVPPGILNPPVEGDDFPAVVGGNVETSQRIVDVVLGALGLAAASQGTMNNLLFGDDTFGYYETICGGAGATPAGPGADAVHTHMTNTRLTDPEVLEHRFPVRLWRFRVRRGSGGRGQHRGGDGVERVIEFLRELDVSLLTQRRKTAPFGLAGGEPGSPGENELQRSELARPEALPPIVSFRSGPGDVLTIRTPGGGAWEKGSN